MAQRIPHTPAHKTPAPVVTPAALREPDTACYIGRSRAYLKKSRLLGTGPSFVRVNRSITYRVVDLDRWLASHVIDTGSEA